MFEMRRLTFLLPFAFVACAEVPMDDANVDTSELAVVSGSVFDEATLDGDIEVALVEVETQAVAATLVIDTDESPITYQFDEVEREVLYRVVVRDADTDELLGETQDELFVEPDATLLDGINIAL